MSAATFTTWRSIVAWAHKYYDPNLPLYYCEQHVRILLDMIGAVLNRREFRYVYTHLPLIEPLVSATADDNVIFLSRYLIALYINQPVRSPIDHITIVHDVDLIGDLSSMLTSSIKGVPACEQEIAQKFTDAENVRFHHLIRLTLLIAHWSQHRVHAIPYTNHARFRNVRGVGDSDELYRRSSNHNANDNNYYYYYGNGGSDDNNDEAEVDEI
nr:GrBNV_gp60-like protein [Apis mellifera nudivirus]